MKLPRAFGLVDLGMAILLLVALVLPERQMYAASAVKGADAQNRYALAHAEARTIAHPDDGEAISDLTRRLGQAHFKDWAIETSVRGTERTKGSPTRWLALFAAAGAYTDRLEIDKAIDYTKRSLSACEAAGPTACPSWEALPVEMFRRHLEAGMASGKDPHSDPDAFRSAGESALRPVRAGGGSPSTNR